MRPESTAHGDGHQFSTSSRVPQPSLRHHPPPVSFREYETRIHAEAHESGAPSRASLIQSAFPWEEAADKRYPANDPKKFNEFEQRYPPDAYGAEAGPNARVWRVYRDRVTELDEDLIGGWHETLNVLLVFAGLFSGVATAFLIEASKRLQPDYGELTSKGVLAILARLDGTVLPHPSSTVTATRDPGIRVINGLWFSSLTLALIVSLLAILVKQWLVEYRSKMRQPASDARRWAWRHFVFRQGLSTWGVGVFISSLAVVLHVALYLFLFGLLVFLFHLDPALCVVAASFTVAAGLFYIVATVAPLWYGDCPSTTPLLSHWRWAAMEMVSFIICTFETVRRALEVTFRRRTRTQRKQERSTKVAAVPPKPAYHGDSLLQYQHSSLAPRVLGWMVENLITDADLGAALAAIGALDVFEHHAHLSRSREYPNPLSQDKLGQAVERRFISLVTAPTKWRDDGWHTAQLGSILRTWWFIRHPVTHDMREHLAQLSSLKTYDIHIMSGMLHNRDRFILGPLYPNSHWVHTDILQRLTECRTFQARGFKQEAMHHLTHQLLFAEVVAAAPANWSYPVLSLLGELILLEHGNPSPAIKWKLLAEAAFEVVRLRVGEHQSDSALQARWHAIPRVEPWYLATLSVWSFVLQFPKVLRAERYQDVAAVYWAMLDEPSLSSQDEFWPFSSVESSLFFFSIIPQELRPGPKPRALLGASRVILRALKPAPSTNSLRDGLKMERYWSAAFGSIAFELLQRFAANPVPVKDLVWTVSNLVSGPDGNEDGHVDFVRLFARHRHATAFIRETQINVLQPRITIDGNTTSAWDMVATMCNALLISITGPASRFAVALALLSQLGERAGVGPHSQSLHALLDELAGGRRAALLALADSGRFVVLAKHAKIVSEDWWREAKAHLRAIDEDQWRRRLCDWEHDSVRELILEVERRPKCHACAAAMTELNAFLDANLPADWTPSPLNSAGIQPRPGSWVTRPASADSDSLSMSLRRPRRGLLRGWGARRSRVKDVEMQQPSSPEVLLIAESTHLQSDESDDSSA